MNVDVKENNITKNPMSTFIYEQVPVKLRVALVKNVVRPAYARANETSLSWHDAIRRDGFMDLVHYEIQNKLLELGDLFPEMVSTFMAPNSVRTCSYAEVRCGSFVITASQARIRGRMPRHAQFRSALAATHNFYLFDDYDSQLQTGDVTYMILSHGIDRNEPEKSVEPSFVNLLVPDEATKKVVYIHDLLCDVSPSNSMEVDLEDDVKLVKPRTIKRTNDNGEGKSKTTKLVNIKRED